MVGNPESIEAQKKLEEENKTLRAELEEKRIELEMMKLEKQKVISTFKNDIYMNYNDHKGGYCLSKNPSYHISIDPYKDFGEKMELFKKHRMWYGGDHGVGWISIVHKPPEKNPTQPQACTIQ